MTNIQSQLDQVLALAEKATPDWRARAHGVVVGGEFNEYTNGKAQSQVASFNVMSNRDNAIGEQVANTELAVSAVNFLREHGPAIRAAVGGEAVAWAHKDGMRILKDDGEGSLYLTSERQDEYGQTIPLYTPPPATIDVGAIRKALNDIREAVTQEPEDKFGYSQVDHGSGIPRAYSVRENILCTIDNRLAALIGKEA